jgi:hypothetical protein
MIIQPAPPTSSCPTGISAMIAPPGRTINPAILANPNITMLSVFDPWATVEPTKGSFNWAYIDSVIRLAAANNKTCLIRIATGGGSALQGGAIPLHVMSEVGNHTFTFTVGGLGQKKGQTITIPVFWNPAFITRKIELYQAFIQHINTSTTLTLAEKQCVKILEVAFCNAVTDDFSFGDDSPSGVQRWLTAGYNTQTMINAAMRIFDSVVPIFPGFVTNAIGVGSAGLDGDKNTLCDGIQTAANQKYHGKVIFQLNSVNAVMPDCPPPITAHAYELSKIKAQGGLTAGQMVWSVWGDKTYRANNGVSGSPDIILMHAYEKAVSYGMKFVETYYIDCEQNNVALAYGATIIGK